MVEVIYTTMLILTLYALVRQQTQVVRRGLHWPNTSATNQISDYSPTPRNIHLSPQHFEREAHKSFTCGLLTMQVNILL